MVSHGNDAFRHPGFLKTFPFFLPTACFLAAFHQFKSAVLIRRFIMPKTPVSPGDDGFEFAPDPSDTEGALPPSDSDMNAEAAEQEAEITASAYGEDLAALKAEIETRLTAACASSTAAASVQEVGGDNILGIGYTTVDAKDLASGASSGEPGTAGLIAFTYERVSDGQLQSEIAAAAGTRALSSVPIIQVPTGVVDAYSHRMRMRTAPGGISVGHFAITAGTLGCLVRGNSPPRHVRRMVLSNNHVLANSNNARLGDAIIQQGRADGGASPRDQIAVLERFIPINFAGGANFVDCATGWTWPDRVRKELMFLSGGVPQFFRIGNCVKNPALNMLVGKTGRTTQLRQGRITGVGVTVNVNYNGRIAQFRDQFSVRGLSGDFSAGGDSGSVIWEWSPQRCAVGLLFAGGGGTTFGNRMSRVLSALDVRLEV
jgi:hypothetical protein